MRKGVRLALGLAAIEGALVAAAAVLLPGPLPADGETGFLPTLFQASQHLAVVRVVAANSTFPLAVTISHASAIVLGVVTALGLAVTIPQDIAHKQAAALSSIPGKGIFFVGLLCILGVPLFFEIPLGESQLSTPLIELVGLNRAALLLWVVAMYVTYFISTLWCAFFVRATLTGTLK